MPKISLDLIEEAFRVFGYADLAQFVDADEDAVTIAVYIGFYAPGRMSGILRLFPDS